MDAKLSGNKPVPFCYDSYAKNQIYIQRRAFSSLFLVAPDDGIGQEEEDYVFEYADVAILSQVVLAMSQGRLETAIFLLEEYLIQEEGPITCAFQSRMILWNGMCYMYLFEGEAAFYWANILLNSENQCLVAEARLLKGMVYRMTGSLDEAMKVFGELSRPNSGLSYAARGLALTWYLDSALSSHHLKPTYNQLHWLQVRSFYDFWCNGIYSAVEYRILHMLNKGVNRRKELLRDMNKSPMLQRPLLTSLLNDLLPKPLKGVEEGARTLWYYG